MISFKPGDHVICIDGAFEPDRELPFNPSEIALPIAGLVYTVREIVRTPCHGEGIRLVECVNREFQHRIGGWQEPCFGPQRFEIWVAAEDDRG